MSNPPPIPPPPPASSPEPSVDTYGGALRWVFVGKGGIRAGWSIAIFLPIVCFLLVVAGGAFVLLGGKLDMKAALPENLLGLEVIQAVPVIAATLLMGLIERRRFRYYGYGGDRRLVKFLGGATVGFVAMGCLAGVLWACHFLVIGGLAVGGATALWFGLRWLLTFFALGVAEESMFRGYMQATLTRGINFWWGAAIMSALFGLVHSTNPGETPFGLVAVAAAGLTFALSLRLTGSLWWAIGSHMAWDWSQSFLFGVADSGMVANGCLLSSHPSGPALLSGGSTGPEGSLLVLPVLGVMSLWLWIRWRKQEL